MIDLTIIQPTYSIVVMAPDKRSSRFCLSSSDSKVRANAPTDGYANPPSSSIMIELIRLACSSLKGMLRGELILSESAEDCARVVASAGLGTCDVLSGDE